MQLYRLMKIVLGAIFILSILILSFQAFKIFLELNSKPMAIYESPSYFNTTESRGNGKPYQTWKKKASINLVSGDSLAVTYQKNSFVIVPKVESLRIKISSGDKIILNDKEDYVYALEVAYSNRQNTMIVGFGEFSRIASQFTNLDSEEGITFEEFMVNYVESGKWVVDN